jgi:hypothetical protein
LRLNPEAIYGDAHFGSYLRDLKGYLEQIPARQFFLIDEAICHLSHATLTRMEQVLLPRKVRRGNGATKRIPLDDLVWPGKAKPIVQGNAKIGTRVVNLTAVGPIKFGARGTVVATYYENAVYSVMLDDVEEYATNLRGRLQSRRGLVAKVDDLFFVGSE